jgi:hypothetical protein
MNHRVPAFAFFACLASSLSRNSYAQLPLAATPEAMTSKASKDALGLTVSLVDAEKKAAGHAATVVVEVRGLKLVDSAAAKELPVAGEGHLHYRLDEGPVIATTATKLSFHQLTAGAHTFKVMLAGNDHSPLGPSQTVTVTVP